MMNPKREAFSMFVAIIVIILMSTVGILVMQMTGKVSKNTLLQYRKEQAILLAKSYTELAVMAVTANDRNNVFTAGNDCLENIDATTEAVAANGYRVRTRISYIGANIFGTCSPQRVLSNGVVTPKSRINIIVDVYVDYQEIDNADSAVWTTYHRRTLQKI